MAKGRRKKPQDGEEPVLCQINCKTPYLQYKLYRDRAPLPFISRYSAVAPLRPVVLRDVRTCSTSPYMTSLRNVRYSHSPRARLRSCYAISCTGLAYAPTGKILRYCYAVSGTDIAYAPTVG
eukprot:1515022-Rhodomonas_salina.1